MMAERGAEIGLDEHEPGGQPGVGDAHEHEAQRADAARVARDQRRQREQERELAELGRLELEERELDPAPRPARREAQQEDHGDEPDRADVERPLEAAEALDCLVVNIHQANSRWGLSTTSGKTWTMSLMLPGTGAMHVAVTIGALIA